MSNAGIPAAPEDMTPEWMTDVLRSRGVLAKARVTSVRAAGIAAGSGFVGRILKLKLGYDIEEKGAPRALVAKLSVADPEMRKILQDFCAREIRFYEEISREARLRTPRRYYSELDIDTGESILLLEELVHARVGNNVTGCSLDDARRAVIDLARFHASWWGTPRLEEIRWLRAFSDDAVAADGRYRDSWETFTAKFADLLTDSILELGLRFMEEIFRVYGRMSERPRTFLHGDFRLDNIFFDDADGSIVAIDWQIPAKGRGPTDVAYLLALCLHTEQRRAVEIDLLRTYHTVLLAEGVREYDFDACLADYRLGLLQPVYRLVTAGARYDFTSERARDLCRVAIQRTDAAATDHNLMDLLST